MKIRDLMISDPITIRKTASIREAIELMKTSSIRHLPVVSPRNKLLGFVTLADLKQGLIPSMVADLSLTDLMIEKPLTVAPDDDIEIAAQLIYNYKIGGMPVVQGKTLVGIITESDILRAFIDMLGILTASSRIDIIVDDRSESFHTATRIIRDKGGDIINVTMTDRKARQRTYSFRLFACATAPIRKNLEAAGFKVVDAID